MSAREITLEDVEVLAMDGIVTADMVVEVDIWEEDNSVFWYFLSIDRSQTTFYVQTPLGPYHFEPNPVLKQMFLDDLSRVEDWDYGDYLQ